MKLSYIKLLILVMLTFVVAVVAFGSDVSAAEHFEPEGQPIETSQPPKCFEREVLVGVLTEKYGETSRSNGLTTSMLSIVEIWASESTGTWTLLRNDSTGYSCVIAWGTDFTVTPVKPKGKAY